MIKLNKYYCPGCGSVITRQSSDKTYSSYCESANRITSAKLFDAQTLELYWLIKKHQPK